MKKISDKKYVLISLITIASFLLFHLIMWFSVTSKLLDVPLPEQIGDLARIGYQPSSAHLRTLETNLPKKYTEANLWDYTPVDIVTIGDSFSSGGGGGENPYYQDYIASENNLSVLNIHTISKDINRIETLMAWYNSGLLEKIKPKAIILESIERSAVIRFSGKIDWNRNLDIEELKEKIRKRNFGDDAPILDKPGIINTANYKMILYNLYYLFSDNALDYSRTYKRKLSQPFFTVTAQDTLLFYQEDITSLHLINEENIQAMNKNFNILARKLSNLGIKLYIMIPPDKYDLYQNFIIDNPYPPNDFFPLARKMDKEYVFIDTKKVLLNLVEQGHKDIYYADDTHWSHKAIKAIFDKYDFNF